MLCVARIGIFFVRPRRAFEVPGVIGIAPVAVEIAKRCADENRGRTGADSLTLNGVENFGTVSELRELHSGSLGPFRSASTTLSEDWIDALTGIPSVPDMSIITGRGDSGATDLLFGKRIAKTSVRIGALGAIDELNTALGLARVAGTDPEITELIDAIQEKLVNLMGEIGCLPEDVSRYENTFGGVVSEEDLKRIEVVALDYESKGVKFTGWARPGAEGSLAKAALDFSRTAARRAEREIWRLHESGEPVRPVILLWLNRLSDLLWILARSDGSPTGD